MRIVANIMIGLLVVVLTPPVLAIMFLYYGVFGGRKKKYPKEHIWLDDETCQSCKATKMEVFTPYGIITCRGHKNPHLVPTKVRNSLQKRDL